MKNLKQLKQWVSWKLIPKNGKNTKVPFQSNGSHASATNSNTWAYYNEINTQNKGFVFTDNDSYLFVDLDHCIESDGKLKAWADDIVKSLNSYTEISPSNDGLHIFVKANFPSGLMNKTKLDDGGAIEIYFSKRYSTVTENIYKGMVDIKKADTDVFYTYCKPIESKKVNEVVNCSKLQDFEIIQRLIDKNHWYKKNYRNVDDSSDDLALMNHLSFWTGCDAIQMERIFSQSELGQRKKWLNRPDYRQMTIEKSINGCSSMYSPQYEKVPIPKELVSHEKKTLNSFKKTFSKDMEALEQMESEEVNIMDNIVFEGQICIVVARPGGGKSLLAQHWAKEMAHKNYQVYYIFEDAGMNIYKQISERGQKYGYSVLSSMANVGQSPEKILEYMQELADNGESLKKVVFIIDTLKKFTEVLDKSANKRFFQILRTLTMRGASFIALAHANKYLDDKGNLIYEGTGDILADTDALYYIYDEGKVDREEKYALLVKEKSRAIDSVDEVCYKFISNSYTAEKNKTIIDVKLKARINEANAIYDEHIKYIVAHIKINALMQKEITDLLNYEFAMNRPKAIELLRLLDGYNWESYRGGDRNHVKFYRLKSL